MVPTENVFNHQSQRINFSEWLSYLTLCLAPLLAHVVAGVPSPVYLCTQRPRWYDHIVHFNPTSILWRYFTITDRRVRTRSWKAPDMLATNALFWTRSGWDGGEQMIEKSFPFCARQPRKTHVDVVSASTLKTFIVTLQGIQALYVLVDSAAGGDNFANNVAISTVFFPLARFGLLRLPAAFWLSDEEIYRNENDVATSQELNSTHSAKSGQSGLPLLAVTPETLSSNYHPIRSWRGLATRAFFLSVPLLLWIVSFALFFPPAGAQRNYFTLTIFSLNLFYLIFLTVTIFTMTIYIFRHDSTTTVIPYIASLWYKLYTGLLFAMMVYVFIVAVWKTRKTPYGRLTTYGTSFDNSHALCGNSSYISSAKTINRPFGIVQRVLNGTFEAKAFDGWCQHGQWKSVDILQGNVTG